MDYSEYLNAEVTDGKNCGKVVKISGGFATISFSIGDKIIRSDSLRKYQIIKRHDSFTSIIHKPQKQSFNNVTENSGNKNLISTDYKLEQLKKYLYRLELKLEKSGFKEFVHFTTIDNLKRIIESGLICSRDKALKLGICNDNYNINSTSKDVLEITSNDVKKFVRFYLRTKNKPLLNMYLNNKKKAIDSTIIALDFKGLSSFMLSNIFKSKQVYLFLRGAIGIRSKDLASDKSMYNVHNLYELSKLDFTDVFSNGDYGYPDETLAELIIKDELPIQYIKCLYFTSEISKNKFLNSISYNLKEKVKSKCIVSVRMFSKYDKSSRFDDI